MGMNFFETNTLEKLQKTQEDMLNIKPLENVLFGKPGSKDYSSFGIIANSNNNSVPTDFLLKDYTNKYNI